MEMREERKKKRPEKGMTNESNKENAKASDLV